MTLDRFTLLEKCRGTSRDIESFAQTIRIETFLLRTVSIARLKWR